MHLLISSLAARRMLKFQNKGLLIPVSLYKADSANCGFARTRVQGQIRLLPMAESRGGSVRQRCEPLNS